MQYKFRGKRKDNGEWVYGSLINNLFVSIEKVPNAPVCYIVPDTTESQKPPYYDCWQDVAEWVDEYEVIPETVGMWTGLKDKNGVEIYNGDILKSFSPSVPSYEVFYDRSSYRLRYKLKCGEWSDWGPLFRMEEIQWEGRLPLCPDVIGNIHDHPHLLTPSQKGDVLNTMYTDPNLQPAGQQEQTQEAAEQATTEQVNAQESAAQDAAVGATEE